MARIRSDLQIEKGLPAGNKVLAKPDGQTEVVQIEPYKVSPTTWVVDDAGIYENVPGQFEIPSLPYAKDVDTAFSRGGKVFKYNSAGGYFELVFDSVVKVIEPTENDIATFAANSGNYTFSSGDIIAIDDGMGAYNLYLYNGSIKTDINSYLPLSVIQTDWSQITNTPTTLGGYGITDAATSAQGALADTAVQPGDNVSGLNNDSGYVDSTGAANAAPVQSVNSQTGAVVLDADDIDDTSTVNKFVSQGEKDDIATAVQPGDLSSVATSGDYGDLINKPTIPDSLDDLSGNSDDITEGSTQLFFTLTERNKLSGIAPGAEVNVNADWNAVGGDAEILNKPTLGTAAAADTGDFATSAQGAKADSAVQRTDTDVSGNDWVLDEDDMVSNSDTKVPTQQSVKAYVDANAGGNPVNPSYGYQTLTDAANISWDMDLGEMAEVTLGGNRTLDNPTNLKKGTYSLIVKQDANGGRTLSYDTAFKWPGGVAPDLTSGPNSIDLLTFVSDGTNLYGAITSDYS